MSFMLRKACLRSVLAGTTALYALALPTIANAQEAQAADEGEEQAIVVTGSRIVRGDYEASSPMVTAGAELLQKSSTAALETNLNKLPNFTPVQTPALGGDVQPTATSTPGAATVSLRGLGTNRSLVLIDGRRGTPANALGVVDINTIPAAAIERVASGDAVFSPRLAGFVLDAFRSAPSEARDAELEELTPREREVLQLIARGYLYKEIGARLHISVKTVETHVSSVLRKLQLSTRHELTRWATDRRLV